VTDLPVLEDPPRVRIPARERLREARGALALLRERSWVLALLGVIVLSAVFVLLGRWQFHRHEARTLRNDRVTANYDAAPVDLTELVPRLRTDPAATLPPDLEWRRVRAVGSYLSEDTVLVRNRPREGQNGYEVLLPFRTTAGPVLLVNRGWIPAGTRSAAAPDQVPVPPSGSVQIVARLRPSEPAAEHRAPAGQTTRIDVPTLARSLAGVPDGSVLGGYGLLDRESPTGPAAPLALPRPDPGIGINLAYAVQWWAFAITAYLVLLVAGMREMRRRTPQDVAERPTHVTRRPADAS
jgi:cytochrome oxidase assembly protein ShyY1